MRFMVVAEENCGSLREAPRFVVVVVVVVFWRWLLPMESGDISCITVRESRVY
jgi:hypothetical protein